MPSFLPSRWIPREWIRLPICAGLSALLAAPGHAAGARSFADLSIEELMNVSITSVSKKEQRFAAAAAAISVFSAEDLHRSGVTNIPDALRLLPGMNVGAVNSSQSAVSARGFNLVYSNKLLVLVDGRAVYNTQFAGVYWDLQQRMLEDLDRIEVVRGPGATLWGANAVNGVINIVSRSARDTQGGLLFAGAGDLEQGFGGFRFGGKAGANTYYRVFGSHHERDDHPLAGGGPANDSWKNSHAGVRVDHYAGPDTHFTWQADATRADLEAGASDAHNLNSVARWTRHLGAGSEIEVQAYVDRLDRNELSRAGSSTDTLDVSAQHSFGWGGRHETVWGLGYRTSRNTLTRTNPLITVRTPKLNHTLFSGFVQDDLQLIPDRLTLTAGVKLEHNAITQLEMQPSIRAVFTPSRHQTLWAAASRAVRTPDLAEGADHGTIVGGAPFQGPDGGFYLPTIVGNPAVESEVLHAYELGYRLQPSPRWSLDIATFFNRYDNLIDPLEVTRLIPARPIGIAEIPFQNSSYTNSWGGELSVRWSPVPSWRLTANYSYLAGRAGSALTDPTVRFPRHQAGLLSSLDVARGVTFDVQARHVAGFDLVPAYVGADARIAWQPTDALELSLVGRNLLDRAHPEEGYAPFATLAEAPRAFHGKITFRF